MEQQISKEVVEALERGNKIAAVSLVRKELKCSLREAKSIIDGIDTSDLERRDRASKLDSKDVQVSYTMSWTDKIFKKLFLNLPVGMILRCLKKAKEHELELNPGMLEVQHMSGGNIQDVVDSLIYAKEHKLEFSYDCACAIDLALKAGSKAVSLPGYVETLRLKGITNINESKFEEGF